MNLKNILIFVSGLVVGAGGGSFITGWIINKKKAMEVQERVNKALESVKDYGVVILDEDVEESEDAPYNIPDHEMYEPEARNQRRSYKPITPFDTDYTSMYKTDRAESEHPMDDEDVEQIDEMSDWADADASSKRKSRPPKLIRREEFGQLPTYDTVDLTYYTGTGILVQDKTGDQISDKDLDEVRSMLGDALDKYGFKDSDEEEIWVRNFDRETDYDIVKVEDFDSDN